MVVGMLVRDSECTCMYTRMRMHAHACACMCRTRSSLGDLMGRVHARRSLGCSKCRWRTGGCAKCRASAGATSKGRGKGGREGVGEGGREGVGEGMDKVEASESRTTEETKDAWGEQGGKRGQSLAKKGKAVEGSRLGKRARALPSAVPK